MLPENTRPLIYAHRGSSIHAPENTLASFGKALEQGADGIELDVKLSADGEVVVIHDQTVNRTTSGQGRVNQLTLEQLRRLDAGSWMGSAFEGERIPTLEEVFELVGGRMVILIELTNYLSPFDGLPQKTVELVRKFKLQDSVIFISFLPSNLKAVKSEWPAAPVGILSLRGLPGMLPRSPISRRFSPDFSLPHYTDVTADFVAKRGQEGRRVNAWVVNTSDGMRNMIDLGVDGIITDDPLLGLKIRGQA